METFSELMMLKGWLTIVEAAQHLTRRAREAVSEADVLRFSLNQTLTLSLRFPTPVAAMKLPRRTLQRISRGDREFDLLEEPGIKIEELEGVYDLPMIGLERYVVENVYRQLIGEPAVDIDEFPLSYCPLVESRQTGAVFGLPILPIPQDMLPEPICEYPHWEHVPFDKLLVVRPDALDAFGSQMCRPTSALPTVVKTGTLVGGPRLAAWLQAEMEKRNHMKSNRLHVLTDLDRKTIKRMLAGQRVHTDSIRKLAQGLSLEGPHVSPDDVPTT